METLRKFGGYAALFLAGSGFGIAYFVPDYKTYGLVLGGFGVALLLGAVLLHQEDLLNMIKGRPFRHGANAVFYSLLVLGIVGAVVFLAARHNRRFDLTEQGEHTLSSQTIKILKSLDQDVTVAAFYSPQAGRQKAIDMLDEYSYHNPRITVRAIDPIRSPGEVRAYNIEQDGTVVVSAKTGEARVTSSMGGGLTEQDLTNAFIKATAKTKNIICFTTGHGEKRIEESSPDGFQQFSEALKKENFDVKEIRLLEGSGGVPVDCSSVIVGGATHAMLPPEAEAIGAYLKGGGRLFVLLEPRQATGLEGLLEKYGLKTGNDFIVDVNPLGRMFGGSPAAPVVHEYGSHPITEGFEGLVTVFPTVGSVQTTTPAETGVTTTPLAHTSAQSWGETGELADRVSFDAATEKGGPLDIAAVAVQKHEVPTDPNATAATEPGAEGASKETRLVLFGDSDFASNGAFTMAGNKDLALNTIAWLNERSDLIAIRPKTQTPQPVVLTGLQARVLFWYSLLLSPVMAMVLGIGVYLRRRRL